MGSKGFGALTVVLCWFVTMLPACAEDVTDVSGALVDWIVNAIILSIFIAFTLMHFSVDVVSKGLKPEAKAKYGRFAAVVGMFTENVLQPESVKTLRLIRLLVRFFIFFPVALIALAKLI